MRWCFRTRPRPGQIPWQARRSEQRGRGTPWHPTDLLQHLLACERSAPAFPAVGSRALRAFLDTKRQRINWPAPCPAATSPPLALRSLDELAAAGRTLVAGVEGRRRQDHDRRSDRAELHAARGHSVHLSTTVHAAHARCVAGDPHLTTSRIVEEAETRGAPSRSA